MRSLIGSFLCETQVKVQGLRFQHHCQIEDSLHGAEKSFIFLHEIIQAKAAFKKWRLVPAPKRAEILTRITNRLVNEKERCSQEMTREMGKVLKETRGDVQEAIDMGYYMAGEGRRQIA